MAIETLPKKIVLNKYDPITVTFPPGEQDSEKIYLGKKAIVGMYCRGNYSGTIVFYGSPTKDGLNLTGNPNADVSQYSYADISTSDGVTATPYRIYTGGNYQYTSLDYSIFTGPNWIIISLENSPDDPLLPVIIDIQCYDI